MVDFIRFSFPNSNLYGNCLQAVYITNAKYRVSGKSERSQYICIWSKALIIIITYIYQFWIEYLHNVIKVIESLTRVVSKIVYSFTVGNSNALILNLG